MEFDNYMDSVLNQALAIQTNILASVSNNKRLKLSLQWAHAKIEKLKRMLAHTEEQTTTFEVERNILANVIQTFNDDLTIDDFTPEFDTELNQHDLFESNQIPDYSLCNHVIIDSVNSTSCRKSDVVEEVIGGNLDEISIDACENEQIPEDSSFNEEFDSNSHTNGHIDALPPEYSPIPETNPPCPDNQNNRTVSDTDSIYFGDFNLSTVYEMYSTNEDENKDTNWCFSTTIDEITSANNAFMSQSAAYVPFQEHAYCIEGADLQEIPVPARSIGQDSVIFEQNKSSFDASSRNEKLDVGLVTETRRPIEDIMIPSESESVELQNEAIVEVKTTDDPGNISVQKFPYNLRKRKHRKKKSTPTPEVKFCIKKLKNINSSSFRKNISNHTHQNNENSPDSAGAVARKNRQKSCSIEGSHLGQIWICEVCKNANRLIKFKSSRGLDTHICKNHPNPYPEYLKCPHRNGNCRKYFESISELREHTNKCHDGEDLSISEDRIFPGQSVWPCSICDKIFSCGSHLSKHIVEHYVNTEGMFNCAYCDCSVRDFTTLYSHQRIFHKNETAKSSTN